MEPKEIEEQLLRQYREDKYGKLHRQLEEAGVPTDIYIGIGMEMYYPSEEQKEFGLNVFDSENLVVYFSQEKKLGRESEKKLRKTIGIAKNLGYEVKSFEILSDEELEQLGLN